MKNLNNWQKHIKISQEWMKKSLTLTDEKLYKKVDENSWSFAQVMNHLYLVEFACYQYVQKKMLNPENLKKPSIKDKFKRFLLKIALALPFKYKAPAIVSQVENPKDYPKFIKDWEELQLKWELLIKYYDAKLENKAIFKHPLGILMNLTETITFMTEHLKHHIPQLEKLNNN